MNPAQLILTRLQLDVREPSSPDWEYAKCVLDIINQNDSRAYRDTEYSNPVDDVVARIQESGVEDDTEALLRFKQLLQPLKDQFSTGA